MEHICSNTEEEKENEEQERNVTPSNTTNKCDECCMEFSDTKTLRMHCLIHKVDNECNIEYGWMDKTDLEMFDEYSRKHLRTEKEHLSDNFRTYENMLLNIDKVVNSDSEKVYDNENICNSETFRNNSADCVVRERLELVSKNATLSRKRCLSGNCTIQNDREKKTQAGSINSEHTNLVVNRGENMKEYFKKRWLPSEASEHEEEVDNEGSHVKRTIYTDIKSSSNQLQNICEANGVTNIKSQEYSDFDIHCETSNSFEDDAEIRSYGNEENKLRTLRIRENISDHSRDTLYKCDHCSVLMKHSQLRKHILTAHSNAQSHGKHTHARGHVHDARNNESRSKKVDEVHQTHAFSYPERISTRAPERVHRDINEHTNIDGHYANTGQGRRSLDNKCHKGGVMNGCIKCQFPYINHHEQVEYMKTHRPVSEPVFLPDYQTRFEHKCGFCGLTFVRREELQHHLAIHVQREIHGQKQKKVLSPEDLQLVLKYL